MEKFVERTSVGGPFVVPVLAMAACLFALGHAEEIARWLEDPEELPRVEAAVNSKVDALRRMGCVLHEVDRLGYSSFDCHGVLVWQAPRVTERWRLDHPGLVP